MICIHNHVLPGVDDGSQSWEETKALMQQAAEEGIEEIIITPHFMKSGPYHLEKDELIKRFERLKKDCRAEGLAIKLHLGNELMIHHDLADLLEDRRINSLADTHYVLVEFPFENYRDEYDEWLYDIRCLGYTIVIAHPERYRFVQRDVNFCLRWLDEGDLLQCNTTSLAEEKKEALIYQMIDHKMVSFFATDSHNEHRPLSMKTAYQKIEKRYGSITAELLFRENAKLLLADERIVNEGYQKIEKKGFFSKLFK